jgi:hypothetical protein
VILSAISDEAGRLMTGVIIWFGSFAFGAIFNSRLFSGSLEKTIRAKTDLNLLFHSLDFFTINQYHQP